MIVQFKPTSMDAFTGKFGDKSITIQRHHDATKQRGQWYIYVEGRRTNAQPRPSAHAAMAVVEHIANKVLYANAKQQNAPTAQQGSLSPTGRKPSSPELQNIPVPSHKPGNGKRVFKTNLKVDYSRVEQRVLAAQAAGKL